MDVTAATTRCLIASDNSDKLRIGIEVDRVQRYHNRGRLSPSRGEKVPGCRDHERSSMISKNKAPCAVEEQTDKVSFYVAWCKRCGICVAFCPREALAQDEKGCPYLAKPDRCTACRVCEMLCPDFAISVGEKVPRRVPESAGKPARREAQASQTASSPERLAAGPANGQNDHG